MGRITKWTNEEQEVYRELEATSTTFHPEAPLAERRERWERLYARHYVRGEWNIGPTGAAMIAMASWYLSFETGDLYTARSVLRQTLEGSNGHDRIDSLELRISQATCDLLLGDTELGVTRFTAIFDDTRFKPHESRLYSCPWIQVVLERCNADTPPNPYMSQLVSKLLLLYPNKKRPAAAALTAETNQDLLGLLR